MSPILPPPMRNSRLRTGGGLWLLVLLLFLGAGLAHGDEVRPAYLQITENTPTGTSYEILWKQPVVQAGRLRIDPIFPQDCVLTDLSAPEVTPSALIRRWQTNCDLSAARIHIEGLSLTLTDVMVRFVHADGETVNYLLRPERPTLDLAGNSEPAIGYLAIGIEHLIFGIDHVLFVVGLVLFIRSPVALLKTITAFTVAHSFSLALSTLGWIRLDQDPVEAVIALSILFLARELVIDETKRSAITRARPWTMAFLFGLLHGLGFAGALAQIGLPEDGLWWSLLLFNVGIEIGQLIIIGALGILGWFFTRLWAPQNIIRMSAMAMGSVAAFWTIDRALVLI